VVIVVAELVSSEFEELPEVRVGAPDLHVVSLSRVLDIP